MDEWVWGLIAIAVAIVYVWDAERAHANIEEKRIKGESHDEH